MRVVAGIDVRFVGLEKIPNGPILIASKHQSIWDTFIMYVILEDPQYILKQELMKIPFWGWYNRRVEHVSVDGVGRCRREVVVVGLCRLGVVGLAGGEPDEL